MSKKYTVIIEADYNDGDYITDVFTVDEPVFIRLKTLFAKGISIFGRSWTRMEDNNSLQLENDLVDGGMRREDAEYIADSIPRDEYGNGTFESFRYVEGLLTTLTGETIE